MKFLVLGGGSQGSACALELARRDDVERVIVADLDVGDPPAFLRQHVGAKMELCRVDARDEAQTRKAMEGVDAVACALPYYFNVDMTRLGTISGEEEETIRTIPEDRRHRFNSSAASITCHGNQAWGLANFEFDSLNCAVNAAGIAV